MKQKEKGPCKEFASLPAILNKDDILGFLRVSKSSLYILLKEIPCWKDEDEGFLTTKSDFIDWIKKNNETIF